MDSRRHPRRRGPDWTASSSDTIRDRHPQDGTTMIILPRTAPLPRPGRGGGFMNRYVYSGGRAVVGDDRRRGGEDDDEGMARANSDRESPLVGTYPYMCPVFWTVSELPFEVAEMEQRERLRDLAAFARLHGNPSKTSPELAVKKDNIDKECAFVDIRTMPVLERTLEYLTGLMDASDEPFELVLDFIFNRSRSVRQDMSMHNIANWKSIRMYEQMGETLSLWLCCVPSLVIKSKEMSFARKVLRYFRMGNYKSFFDTVAVEASYLQYFAIDPS